MTPVLLLYSIHNSQKKKRPKYLVVREIFRTFANDIAMKKTIKHIDKLKSY